jgi:Tfp pilus assembly protein PilX
MKRARKHDLRSGSFPASRRGAALMFCMFIVFMITLLVVNVLDTTTLDLSGLRNSIDYERALYLANAGVHAAAAELEANPGWRGVITDGAFPADDTYTATVADGAAGTVDIVARGASGDVTRTVIASVQL